MMKNKIFLACCLMMLFVFFIGFPIASFAQGQSSDSATSLIDKLKKIEILKEKIATKVAELREKEQGGLFGIVETIEQSKLILRTKEGEKTVGFSDDTVFYSLAFVNTKKESSAQNMKTGIPLAALGYFDSDRTSLSAKYVYLSSPSAKNIAKISDIDKSNNTITVIENQASSLIDIETYSKLFTYSKDKGFLKGGFSKLKVGDTVHFSANANPKEENRYSALRLYAFTFTPASTLSPPPTATATAKPKATPTIKPKPTVKQSTSSATPTTKK